MNNKAPLPLFDSLENIKSQGGLSPDMAEYNQTDITLAMRFLIAYQGSKGTFNSYRREVERLLHWVVLIAKKNLAEVTRDDITLFLEFCQNPPQHWIGKSKPPRFINQDGKRVPNSNWRPFVATVSKAQHRKGLTPDVARFELSYASLRETLVILGSFFSFLVEEEYININPVALIRQKSKVIRRSQSSLTVRRLTDTQWHYVIKEAEYLAAHNPEEHERTLFIMTCLYSMYLRISELVATERWLPTMNHFIRDSDGNWWFTTVGKGNKQRTIAVSDAMLKALSRWRLFREMSALPSPADNAPLFTKIRGKGPISSTNAIRKIVQFCFDRAIERLTKDGHQEDADNLNEATVHWLRHTGISDDVKVRPREHVRDDAGHSSGAITDKYIDIELKERHQSAKTKKISEASKISGTQ